MAVDSVTASCVSSRESIPQRQPQDAQGVPSMDRRQVCSECLLVQIACRGLLGQEGRAGGLRARRRCPVPHDAAPDSSVRRVPINRERTAEPAALLRPRAARASSEARLVKRAAMSNCLSDRTLGAPLARVPRPRGRVPRANARRPSLRICGRRLMPGPTRCMYGKRRNSPPIGEARIGHRARADAPKAKEPRARTIAPHGTGLGH